MGAPVVQRPLRLGSRLSVCVMCIVLLSCLMFAFADEMRCVRSTGKTAEGLTEAELLDDLVEQNKKRRQKGRVASAFIYLFITIGYLAMASLFGVLMGWLWQPFTGMLTKMKGPMPAVKVTQNNTLVWVLLCLAVTLILTAGGLPGWMVLGFLFAVGCSCVFIVACIIRRDGRRVTPHPHQTTNGENVDPEAPNSPTLEGDVVAKGHGRQMNDWTEHPTTLGRVQTFISIALVGCMALFLLLTLIVFFSWNPSPYKVYAPRQRCELDEFIPINTARALQLMYAWEGLASNLRAGIYAKLASSYCSSQYTKVLDDDEKEEALYKSWVELYQINMTWYTPSDWRNYSSVNEWFIREINSEQYRPIDPTKPASQIVAPCDSRVLVFPVITDSKVWIKGHTFSVAELLGEEEGSYLHSLFSSGTMVISRLAPQDYHRFHTPIGNALVESVKAIEGSHWSVNPDAVISGNGAFYNMRSVVILSSPIFGKVAVIAIGATCVGSVVITTTEGTVLKLGDEIGYMQFGGSTVVVLFESGKASFAAELLNRSTLPIESYMPMNAYLGQAHLSN